VNAKKQRVLQSSLFSPASSSTLKSGTSSNASILHTLVEKQPFLKDPFLSKRKDNNITDTTYLVKRKMEAIEGGMTSQEKGIQNLHQENGNNGGSLTLLGNYGSSSSDNDD
jgi:hypothetical protein